MRLAAVALALLCFGCGQDQQSVSSRDQAVDDLNHRNYPDAIALLEPLHAASPNDGQVSVLLASAYVGSVGFDIVDAYDAFAPLMFNDLKQSGFKLLDATTSPPASAAPASAAPATSPAPATDAAPGSDLVQQLESSTIKFLAEVTADFKTLAGVPFPDETSRRRLVQALLVLESIDPKDASYVEGKSYAAVVGAFQFLNYTRDAMTDALTKDQITAIDALCALKVDTFLQNLDTASDYLVHSIDDLQVAYKAHNKQLPSNLSGLGSAAQHVRQLYDNNQGSFSNAGLAFEATKASYCK